ncbi:hypothetical protein CLIB1444_04S03268 [[Candida] jaroonii]|uniref:Uncharacterized protein n=1 Tax=[Candida] jaroonii TaxID=467808 RepID=A0ACA9Y811_9ASCO|nr:hypothetical protein CLIB1444_04S03268 [[Candida] jaroonii]
MSKLNSFKDLPLPDLRFEQSFVASLHKYADTQPKLDQMSVEQLDQLNVELDRREQEELINPLPITPSIVTYAVIKDQILMPLIQGFLYTGALILVRPILRMIVLNGQNFGHSLASFIGINQILRR